MTCSHCEQIAATEHDHDAPDPVGACSCAEDPDRIDVLLVENPEVLRAEHRSMIGQPVTTTWAGLCALLLRPMTPTHCALPGCKACKMEFGAFTLGRWRENHKKKEKLICSSGLLIDVDDGGDVDRVAEILMGHRAVVHSTFSSTPEAPRCRIVLPFKQPLPDVASHEKTWRVVVAHLEAAGLGIGVDEGTKDAGRLAFLPCVASGAEYRVRVLDGDPIDAEAILAAQPAEPPRSIVSLPRPEHRDRYVAAALSKAADAVAFASEGMRHYTVGKEAFCLARLELSEGEISAALLPAFVAAAGEGRRHEGERTIRDAVRARLGAA